MMGDSSNTQAIQTVSSDVHPINPINEPPPPYTLLHHKTPITSFQEGYPTYLQPTTPQVLCVSEDVLERLQKAQDRRNRELEEDESLWADCYICWRWVRSLFRCRNPSSDSHVSMKNKR